MADIAMCLNNNCTKRWECYRYTAEPCECGQAYFSDDGYVELDGCYMFWSNEEVRSPLETISGGGRPSLWEYIDREIMIRVGENVNMESQGY